MNTPINYRTCSVNGVRIFELPTVQDDVRGHLTVGEFDQFLPFIPRRFFVTYAIPSKLARGEHAHRRCAQFLVSVGGSCRVTVDDGRSQESFTLRHPSMGLYVPPMVWAAEFEHTADSALLVFASHRYDPSDYIRDYSEFQMQTRPEVQAS